MGSVTSAIAQQFLYATTPLSFAVAIGLLNRRRLQAQQEDNSQRLGNFDQLRQEVTQLRQQATTMPPPEIITGMERQQRQQQQVMEEMTGYVKSAYSMMGSRLVKLEEQDYDAIAQDISRLRAAHGSIHTLLDNMQASLQEMTTREQVEGVERAIAQLQQKVKQVDHQFQHLDDKMTPALSHLQTQFEQLAQPPVPANKTADFGEERLNEIINLMADLVPRRDWNTISAQVQSLQRRYQSQSERDQQLDQKLGALQQQLSKSKDDSLEPLHRRWQAILEAVQDKIQALPNSADLESVLEEMLHRRLQAFPAQATPHQLLIDLPVEASGGNAVANTPAASPRPATCSRLALEEALQQAEDRVVLTWPWAASYQLEASLAQQLTTFLESGKSLFVGWCSQRSHQGAHFLPPIRQTWSLDASSPAVRHATLQYFLQLKRRYPKSLHFKLLEAGENFLIVDRAQAVVGIDHPLIPAAKTQTLGLKIRTTSASTINALIERYTHSEQISSRAELGWRQAMVQYDLGEGVAAAAELDRLLAAAPDDAVAYNMRGILRYGQRDYDAALGDLSQAIQVDPDLGSPYCNRGFLRHKQRDIEGAIADFEQAVQLMPVSVIPLFYRGRAWESLNQFTLALKDYNAAHALAPDSAIVLYRRALVHQHLQQLPQAQNDLNTAAWNFIHQDNPSAARRCLQVLKQWEHPQSRALNSPSNIPTITSLQQALEHLAC